MAISYRAAQTLIKRGDEDALQNALSNGLDANLANANGWTLLMLAAVEGSVPCGRLLLHYGARPAAQNSKHESALLIARAKGHSAFAELLTGEASPGQPSAEAVQEEPPSA